MNEFDDAISDKDKVRTDEQQKSLDRQGARRELRDFEEKVKAQRDIELGKASGTKQRRLAKEKAKQILEQANADFDNVYRPQKNKQDYESDTTQRGIDQFRISDATPPANPSTPIEGGGGGIPDGFSEETLDVVAAGNSAVQRIFLTKTV